MTNQNQQINDVGDQHLKISSDDMPAPSLGELLQEERIKQKLTTKDVASHLKVLERYVVAIEESNFDELPGKIFTQGYLRAYAQMVHFDENEAERHIKLLCSPDTKKSFTISGMPRRKIKLSPSLLFAAISIIVLLTIASLAGVWFYHHFRVSNLAETYTAARPTNFMTGKDRKSAAYLYLQEEPKNSHSGKEI